MTSEPDRTLMFQQQPLFPPQPGSGDVKLADYQQMLRVINHVLGIAAPYPGFASWNDFFIREFKPGMRPVASPDDDRVIVSACESAPWTSGENSANVTVNSFLARSN